MHNKFQRIVMLCPDLHEIGGIGAVSRMSLAVLCSQGNAGEVWSFGAPAQDQEVPHPASWSVRYANGNKAQFGRWALQAGLHNAKDQLVVAMHLQLAPAAWPLIKRGARLAVFLHGIEAWEPLSVLRARAVAKADLLLANSQFTARQFLAANPQFRETPIKICALGVPDVAERANGEEGEAKPPFAFIVGRLSSQERYKGHDELLSIWHRVLSFHPTARLVVAGDGDDRPRLEAKANELGLGASVQFLGSVNGVSLQALYDDCAFFAMPSAREGFGLAFLEAMRAGKACIGAQGAAEEIIEHEMTGWIVPPANPMVLLEAIHRFFEEPVLCGTLGRAGRDRFRAHFTEAHFQNRLARALEFESER
jgi:phosphatidyl-myo-inositol dimannoside synthase